MVNHLSKRFIALLMLSWIGCNFVQAATTAQTLAQQQEAAKAAAAKAAAAKAAAAKAAATTTKTTAMNAGVTAAAVAKPVVVATKASTANSPSNPLKPPTSITSKSASPLPGAEKPNAQITSPGGPSDSSNYITASPTSSQQ